MPHEIDNVLAKLNWMRREPHLTSRRNESQEQMGSTKNSRVSLGKADLRILRVCNLHFLIYIFQFSSPAEQITLLNEEIEK